MWKGGGPGAIRTPDPQIRSLIAGVESKGKIAQLPRNHSVSDQQLAISLQTDAAPENENPGALAGATGADFKVWLDWIDTNTRRESAARELLEAVLACDPRDRVPLMELFIEALRPGEPVAAFDGVMREASFWADWASTAELKAYALASYTHLSAADQRAFLGHVQGRAAA